MSWWSLHVTPGAAGRAELARWLVDETGHAVEERDDGSLAACAQSAGAVQDLAHRISQQFALDASVAELDEVDWSIHWRDGIVPRHFGRLLLVPSWLSAAESHTGPRIVLDPENAFGSGEHGSTRSALALLERHLQPDSRVLDLGSGSGILAIAAVVLGAQRAIGVECDDESNLVAQHNAGINKVADRTLFLTGDAALLAPVAGPAELVLSNILRTVNVTLLPAIRQALVPGGLAIFAGMEEPEAPLFLSALRETAFAVVDEVRDAGWWGVAARLQ